MDKKMFEIEITEFLQRVVEIEAENVDVAIETVIQKYKTEEIVLDWNDYIDTDIDIYVNDELFQNFVRDIKFRDFVFDRAKSKLVHLSVEELSKLAFRNYESAIFNYKNLTENNC